jgi:hypothetical protein
MPSHKGANNRDNFVDNSRKEHHKDARKPKPMLWHKPRYGFPKIETTQQPNGQEIVNNLNILSILGIAAKYTAEKPKKHRRKPHRPRNP